MKTLRRLILVQLTLLVLMLAAPGISWAEGPAELRLGASSVTSEKKFWRRLPAFDFKFALTRPVPYRVSIVSDPVRLIVDLKDTELPPQSANQLFGASTLPALRWGAMKGGWSRIVAELPGPYRIVKAGQSTTPPQPEIHIQLEPVSAAEFTALPGASSAQRNLPEPADSAPPADPGDSFVVVIDPGHGGYDPGAVVDGETESNLVLTFAQELRPVLDAQGIAVEMTRVNDVFVGLEQRMTLARNASADLFISLHADALPSGQAAGATVYVWSPAADSAASAQLARRHGRSDLVSGVDLTGQDDALATALMDFVRTDTQVRSVNFAEFLRSSMALKRISLHGRPVQGAAFSVLKSPDIPSVLFELGFLTDPVDRANLTNPQWRAVMVQVVADAVKNWAADEAARREGLRN